MILAMMEAEKSNLLHRLVFPDRRHNLLARYFEGFLQLARQGKPRLKVWHVRANYHHQLLLLLLRLPSIQIQINRGGIICMMARLRHRG